MGSYLCACSPGYNGPPDNCVDIDECSSNNGGCLHLCVNTRKSLQSRVDVRFDDLVVLSWIKNAVKHRGNGIEHLDLYLWCMAERAGDVLMVYASTVECFVDAMSISDRLIQVFERNTPHQGVYSVRLSDSFCSLISLLSLSVSLSLSLSLSLL